jgi:hypothetical protein
MQWTCSTNREMRNAYKRLVMGIMKLCVWKILKLRSNFLDLEQNGNKPHSSSYLCFQNTRNKIRNKPTNYATNSCSRFPRKCWEWLRFRTNLHFQETRVFMTVLKNRVICYTLSHFYRIHTLIQHSYLSKFIFRLLVYPPPPRNFC